MYKIFCYLNFPLWAFILLYRKFKGKEHNKRYIEKLGYGYLERPRGEVIWVHALGLGETLSLTLFINTRAQQYKNNTILFVKHDSEQRTSYYIIVSTVFTFYYYI